jgi:hypothetical protein
VASRRFPWNDSWRVTLVLAIVFAWSPPAAFAGSHLWRFSEFYSSPDRSIQFIEMQEIGGSEDETAISNHWFKTNGYNGAMTELLGADLPFGTADKKFLVGTLSYAALPGVPQPDYLIPDGAIDPTGDFIVWWFYQVIAIPSGVMPADGVHSIVVVDPNPAEPVYAVETNSPTNFAGEMGSVVLAQKVPALPLGRGLLIALLGSLGFWLVLRRTADPL